MTLPVSAALAQTAPSGGGLSIQFLVSLALMFGIFYFLLIAPARRKQKKHTEMLNNLKNGDKIITQGGLYGVVTAVSDQVVQLRIADNVKVEMAKHAVSGLQSPAEE